MDDKILFYIVLGIIYFLFNHLKKKKPVEPDLDSPQDNNPQSGPKPMSFEDLLKEITETKQPTPQPTVARKVEYETYKQKPAYVDYDDDIEEEGKSLEEIIDDEKATKIYEEAKKLAFQRPSLEETMKLEQVNTEYAKFKQFESKEDDVILVDYLKELRDPKGFKKALVLSEVLNRKHF